VDPFLILPIQTPSPPEDREARYDIAKLRESIVDLQGRLGRQSLLVRALFLLLQEKLGLTEDELLSHLKSAIARQESEQTKKCTVCNRAVNLKHQRCAYCGVPQPTSVFELV
jgi:hypothetical protein